MTMYEALIHYAKIDVEKLSDNEIYDLLDQNNIEYKMDLTSRGLAIALLFEELCEKNLIQPVFITDHPKETSPLCKLKRGNPDLIERFEPYINTWEMGNAYSELTDPILQRKLFEEQAERGRGGDEEAQQMDEDFLRSIEYGLPPTGGLGLGVDRMVMILTNAISIREVIFFPTMKPETN